MAPVLVEYVETGLVPRMPTWVLSVGLLLLSMLMMVTGLILDSVSRGRAEQKRIFYLSMPSTQRGSRDGRSAGRRRRRTATARRRARHEAPVAVPRRRRRSASSPTRRCSPCWCTRSSLNPFLARLLSIGFALAVTWLINRTVTFGPSSRHVAVEGARYGGVGIGTSLVNYARLFGAHRGNPGLAAA